MGMNHTRQPAFRIGSLCPSPFKWLRTGSVFAVAAIDEVIDTGAWKAAAWWVEWRRRGDWGRAQSMPVVQPEQEKMAQTFPSLV
jgi:hypothetical protein